MRSDLADRCTDIYAVWLFRSHISADLRLVAPDNLPPVDRNHGFPHVTLQPEFLSVTPKT